MNNRLGKSGEISAGGWTGRDVIRREDAALLKGRGLFADDLGVRPGTVFAAFVRSPHAHARLLRINKDGAASLNGVHAIITGADAERWTQPFVVGVKEPMKHWCLAVGKVRYVGEPVAIVVADSRYIAEDAVDLVDVEYEPLPVVSSIESAIESNAPLLHSEVGSNCVSDRNFVYGDPVGVFEKANRHFELNIEYPRNTCTPIETFVVVADHLLEKGYDVLSNFMGPLSLHAVMALSLRVPASKLRLRMPPDSGGSFGVKQAVFPYIVALCLASRKVGKPVKWVEDRLEHLLAATAATGRKAKIRAATDHTGRILALEYDQIDDVGGYLRAPEPATFYRMHGCLTGAYDIRHLKVRNRVVLTNKVPAGLVRGFGGPQVYYALERLVHEIGKKLNIEASDMFIRNFIPSDTFPYRAAGGALIDSGNYQTTQKRGEEAANLNELYAKRTAARKEGRLYGIGFAAIVEPSISNMGYITTVLEREDREAAGPKNGAIATATVAIDLLGGITVGVASVPQGQGHATALSQVVADVFGVEPSAIVVNSDLDTQKDAWSTASGNYSSRFAGAVAGTAFLAAKKIRNKLSKIAAAQFECHEQEIVFADNKVFQKGKESRQISFQRLASGEHWAPGLVPKDIGLGLKETVFWSPSVLEAPDENDRINTSATYGFVYDICALEIDRKSGGVRIDRYVTAHDAGRLLNPGLVDGQIRGGFSQGIGAALLEEVVYTKDGNLLSGTFADYLVPTATDVIDPIIVHTESPSPFTPLGSKGVGEGNSMSTPVCIANAIADALGNNVDPEKIVLPMSPSKIMALIGIDDPSPQNYDSCYKPKPDVVSKKSRSLFDWLRRNES